MNTTTNTPTESGPIDTAKLDGELKETSFGAWIAENKSLTISLIVLIFLGLIGYGVFNHFQTKKNNEYATILFNFTQDNLSSFREGKLEAKELVAKYSATLEEVGSFDGAGSFSVEVVDALSEKGNYEMAYSVATEAMDKVSNDQAAYFLRMRAAVLAENLNKLDEALKHLNTLISGSIKYMEDKIYLDLGRLQLKTGDTEKAKSSFQHVIDNGKEEEFKKMAKLYLSEL